MSKLQLLNEFLRQRLTALSAEIFGAVEKTITEYKEEVSNSNEEIERLQKLLDLALKPDSKLHEADTQMLIVPEDFHCEPELGPSLGQEDSCPADIQWEQELLTGQEGIQYQRFNTDIAELFSPLCVKKHYDQKQPKPLLTPNRTETMDIDPDLEKDWMSETSINFQPISVTSPEPSATQNYISGCIDIVPSRGLLSALGLVRATGVQTGVGGRRTKRLPHKKVQCPNSSVLGRKIAKLHKTAQSLNTSAGGRRTTKSTLKTVQSPNTSVTITQLRTLQNRNTSAVGGMTINSPIQTVQSLNTSRVGRTTTKSPLKTAQSSITSVGGTKATQTNIESVQRPNNSVGVRKTTKLPLETVKNSNNNIVRKTAKSPFETMQSTNASAIGAIITKLPLKTLRSPKISVGGRRTARSSHVRVETGGLRSAIQLVRTLRTRIKKEQNSSIGLEARKTTTFSHNKGQSSLAIDVVRKAPRLSKVTSPNKSPTSHCCKMCGKSFVFMSYLVSHVQKMHLKDKYHLCGVCGKDFMSTDSMVSHLQTHIGVKHFCHACAKVFTCSSNLKVHMRIHTGERPFKCKECGKGFTVRKSLKDHVRNHTGERPHKCSKCGKCFASTTHLSRHQEIHTGEKPYQCNDCGKSFSRKEKLAEHIRTHTGEKPFPCPKCGKCFGLKGNLNTHMIRHTGEKPCKCIQCGKGFSLNADLKIHMRTHTGEKRYKCTVCDKSFTQKGYLAGHILKHTGEKQ